MLEISEYPIGEINIQKLTDNSYWILHNLHAMTLYVGETGALLVDSAESLFVDRLLERIAKITPNPITTLVYTHPHLDHIKGATGLVEALIFLTTRRSGRGLRQSNRLTWNSQPRMRLVGPVAGPTGAAFVRISASDGFNSAEDTVFLNLGDATDRTSLKRYNTRGPNIPGMCSRKNCVASKTHTLVASNPHSEEGVVVDLQLTLVSAPDPACTINDKGQDDSIYVATAVFMEPGSTSQHKVDVTFECPDSVDLNVESDFVLQAAVRRGSASKPRPARQTQTPRAEQARLLPGGSAGETPPYRLPAEKVHQVFPRREIGTGAPSLP